MYTIKCSRLLLRKKKNCSSLLVFVCWSVFEPIGESDVRTKHLNLFQPVFF